LEATKLASGQSQQISLSFLRLFPPGTILKTWRLPN
jgi:hypothetical protein